MFNNLFAALLFSALMLVCAERAVHNWSEVRVAYTPV